MRVRVFSATLVALAGMILGLSPLHATLIVGGPGDAGVGDCIPFGCSDASIYQQVFDKSVFPAPITIAGLTFYLNNFDNTDPLTGSPIVPDTIYPANYTITLAVVPVPVDGLDTDVENNLLNSSPQTFFIGFLGNSVSGQFTIQTTPPNYFHYDPALGNLLVDIRSDGSDPSLTMYLDINSASGGAFSSAFDSNPHPFGCPDFSPGTTTGCANLDYGLVTGFNTPADFGTSPPEPGTLWLGLGGAVWIGLSKFWKRRAQGL